MPVGIDQDTGLAQARRIVELNIYGAQDGSLHDEQDSREAMTTRKRCRQVA